MSDIQAIKDRLDIVDLISEYVQLRPAGINMKGLCPFHNEKSPSFMVNKERQTFKCFGCAKGGDIFTFIQEIEGMEFAEALKLLADKAGVTLTKQTKEVDTNEKNKIKTINQEAARFFYKFLAEMPASQEARAYLQSREITQKTIDDWQIGYIPDQWDLLTKYLLKKGFAIEDLVAAGITIKREQGEKNTQTGKGFYDRFRGRIMFPIRDIHGVVVGFTGRVLKETDRSGGKYVNTPQTLVYDKSRIVFGLDKARQAIRQKKSVVLVEGQMDVIACHQSGMENVVATSGTAMTEHQVALLIRYAKDMRIAFDADEAGQAAAKRGIDIAIKSGMHVKVITIPQGYGKDPDECVKKNKDMWVQSVEQAKDVMEWYMEKARYGKEMASPEHKQQIADEVLPEIAKIPYAVEKDHWLQQLSRILNVDAHILREDMNRLAQIQVSNTITSASVGHQAEQAMAVQKSPNQGKLEVLWEKWFGFGLRYPKQLRESITHIPHVIVSTTIFAPLYEEIKKQYTDSDMLDLHGVRERIPTTKAGEHIVDILLMKNEWEFSHIDEDKAKKEMSILVAHIKEEWVKQERKRLETEIRIAEEQKDRERVETLIKSFQELYNYL